VTAEVGRRHRHLRSDVVAGLVPVRQRGHSERMPKPGICAALIVLLADNGAHGPVAFGGVDEARATTPGRS
jgi:hypothetical protein